MEVRKYIRQGLWGIVLIVASTTYIHAQSVGASFLQLEIGGRSQALGGAFTAINSGANSLHYNPAGLSFNQNRELALFHAQWFADITIENATLLLPVNSWLTLAHGVSFLRMPEMQRYDIDQSSGDPIESGSFNAYNLLLTNGIGLRLNDQFSVGLTIKWLQESLENTRAQALAADFGMLMRLFENRLQIGAAIQNIGSKIQYETQSSNLPETIRAGAAYRIGGSGNLVTVDVVKSKNEEWEVRPGVELSMNEQFSLRGGYQASSNANSGLSAGIGLKLLDEHQLNYTYTPYGELGNTHRAEVVINLGTPDALAYRDQITSLKTTTENKAIQVINQPSVANEQLPIEIIKEVQAPIHLKLEKTADDKMKLSWEAVPNPHARYHIYAQPVGSESWIKITKAPVSNNFQLFAPKKDGVHLFLAVSTVIDDYESPLSLPVEFINR